MENKWSDECVSPGQFFIIVQSSVWIFSPRQLWPPYLGAGLSHLRCCVCFPTPQVTEQSEGADQAPQFPFTVETYFLC